jgi:alkaline phosphatase D
MILRRTISRRMLLTGSAAALAVAPWRGGWAQGRYPFALGVASGNPRADAVVLWTRLAPEPLAQDPARPGGMPASPVAVQWEIAGDP